MDNRIEVYSTPNQPKISVYEMEKQAEQFMKTSLVVVLGCLAILALALVLIFA